MRAMSIRFLVKVVVIVVSTFAGHRSVLAQAYPDRPIRVIVPFAGGSASDVLARVVIEQIGHASGKSFVVDNRPGAGGNIGTVAAARAEPDGYTLLMNGLPLVVSKMLLDNPGFDLRKDFEPIALYAIVPNIVAIHSTLPVNSVSEFIAYAKARPKQINYASVGIGSSQHLAGAYFEHMAGVEMTHVPYRVTSQLVSDMISGRVQAGFQIMPNVLGMINDGKVRALAVTTKKRMTALPNTPTVSETAIPGFDVAAWFAFLAPKGTPSPIITYLNKQIAEAMNSPAVRDRFVALGTEPVISSPEELERFFLSEETKWTEVIGRSGIKISQ